MVKTMNVAVLLAILVLGVFGATVGTITIATYAQVEQPSVVDGTSIVIGAIASVIASVGGLLLALGPLIKRFNKPLGDAVENAGTEALKWNHYTITIAAELKKYKALYEVTKESVLNSVHATPEQRAAVTAAERKLTEIEAKIQQEADYQRSQIDKVADTIKAKALTDEEIEEEKVL